jgi:hypothetical protein
MILDIRKYCFGAMAALLVSIRLSGLVVAQDDEPVSAPPTGESAPAAADLSAFEFYSELDLPAQSAATYFDFVLPVSVFDGARYDLGDVRLYTADGEEVPFALRIRREGKDSQPITASEFNRTHAEDGTAELTLDLGEEGYEHNEVEIRTAGDNFRRRATVEGSSDQENWRLLAEENLLKFDLPEPEKDVDEHTLVYPASRFRYLRIRVHPDPVVDADRDTESVIINEAAVTRMVVLPGEYLITPAKLSEREPVRANGRIPGSAWRISLGGNNIPCEKLLVEIANAEFNRNYEIQPLPPDVTNEMVVWGTAYSGGTWKRVAGEKVEPMTAEFPVGSVASRLKLTITDHANQPLSVTGVKFSAPVRQIVFASSQNLKGPLRLYFGNPAALPPEYDFARNLPPKLESQPERLKLLPRESNPSYIPPPKALTERWPWLIYVVLSGVSLALGGIIMGLGKAAIARHDAQTASSTAADPAH